MAIPMPARERDEYATELKRVVVKVPVEQGFLMDLVARYSGTTLKRLYEDIWRAGFAAHLGVAPDEFDECQVSPLPRGTAVPGDVKKLAQALISDR